tara:strand:+ start:1648 stop:3051 length:1404 start_codon:yes stop_codon:yes gene_type:complete
MSLPVVKAGNYNYGEYANPTPIKYKGGLGEGLAKGIAQGTKAFFEAKKKQEKLNDAANTESALKQREFQLTADKYLQNASEENKKFVIAQKQAYGETVRLFKLKQISLDEYSKRMSGFDNLLLKLQGLNGAVESASKINNGEDLDLTALRSNPAAYDAEIKRRSLIKGGFLLSGDYENGYNIEMPKYDARMSQGKINEYPTEIVTLNDLLGKTDIYIPQLKYDNNLNSKYTTIKNNLFKSSGGKDLYITEENKNNSGRIVTKFDPSKINEIKDFIRKDNTFISALTSKEQRLFYEDDLGNGLGSFSGAPDQIKAVNDAIVDSLAEDLVNGGVISDTKYTKPRDAVSLRADQMNKIRETLDKEAPFRNKIAKVYGQLIEYNDDNTGIKDFRKLKNQLNNIGITITGSFADEEGKLPNSLTLKGPYGQTADIDFTATNENTLDAVLYNLSGGIAIDEKRSYMDPDLMLD